MTNGYVWNLSSNRTVNWSLSNGWFGEFWTNQYGAANQISLALETFSYYANINFTYSGYYSSPAAASTYGSDINFAGDSYNINFNSNSVWAIGNFPIPNSPERGRIYLNNNSNMNFIMNLGK